MNWRMILVNKLLKIMKICIIVSMNYKIENRQIENRPIAISSNHPIVQSPNHPIYNNGSPSENGEVADIQPNGYRQFSPMEKGELAIIQPYDYFMTT
jgi:hypothetical protein